MLPIRPRKKRGLPLRFLVVFDLFDKIYDPQLGQLYRQNHLPIMVIVLSVKGMTARAADAGLPTRVNRDTGYAHNVNSKNSVPLHVVDQTTTEPLYLHPRDPSLL